MTNSLCYCVFCGAEFDNSGELSDHVLIKHG